MEGGDDEIRWEREEREEIMKGTEREEMVEVRKLDQRPETDLTRSCSYI